MSLLTVATDNLSEKSPIIDSDVKVIANLDSNGNFPSEKDLINDSETNNEEIIDVESIDETDTEEIHNVSVTVTICAAFPAGNFFFQLFFV